MATRSHIPELGGVAQGREGLMLHDFRRSITLLLPFKSVAAVHLDGLILQALLSFWQRRRALQVCLATTLDDPAIQYGFQLVSSAPGTMNFFWIRLRMCPETASSSPRRISIDMIGRIWNVALNFLDRVSQAVHAWLAATEDAVSTIFRLPTASPAPPR